MAAIAGRRYAR